MRMSSATRKQSARNLRRKAIAATSAYAARSVPDLMAELHEAEIRARIKRARKESGLSQNSMAELLGVIPRTVQNYENDHVPWTRIKDIADITGVSTRWLLHGDDAAPAEDEQVVALSERLTAVEQMLKQLQFETATRDMEAMKLLGEVAQAIRRPQPRQRP